MKAARELQARRGERTQAYPSDVTDNEWAIAGAYLALVSEAAPQRKYPLREVFDGLRQVVKTGGQWRRMPHDLRPRPAAYRQTQRWLAAGCFEVVLDDLAPRTRRAADRASVPGGEL